jgi:hypothetical protein
MSHAAGNQPPFAVGPWVLAATVLLPLLRLTQTLHKMYTSNRAYYAASTLGGLTHADQRITEDVEKFCFSVSDLYSHTFKVHAAAASPAATSVARQNHAPAAARLLQSSCGCMFQLVAGRRLCV